MATTGVTDMEQMSAILTKLEASVQQMDESIKTLTSDTTANTDLINKMNKDLNKKMDDLITNDTKNAQNTQVHKEKIQMLTADVQMLKKEMKERQRKEKELNIIIRRVPEIKKRNDARNNI